MRCGVSKIRLLAVLAGICLQFPGTALGESTGTSAAGPLRLGLFIPTEGGDAEAGRAVQGGAALALEFLEGTRIPAFSGVELVVIPSSLPWGAQMGELVRAFYDRGVRIIIGGIDREAAHLAGQFVAREKGEVLFVSLGDDPTITQTGVPWLLRHLPADPDEGDSPPAERRDSPGDLSGVTRPADFQWMCAARLGASAAPKALLACETVLGVVSAAIETGIDPDRMARFLTTPSTGGPEAQRWVGSN